ncbi:MAG: tetratricopeptide repeat protein [Escherichia sp.]
MTQSYRRAKDWFEKAAEKGHVDAQYNLGVIYENGEGVSQNYQQAKAWYERQPHKMMRRRSSNLAL